MIEMRKLITTRETVFSELGVEPTRPIARAVGMAVIRNPFAGQFVEDLRPLFEAGAMLGERLMPELVKLLDGPAVSYGKGAIVASSPVPRRVLAHESGLFRRIPARFLAPE